MSIRVLFAHGIEVRADDGRTIQINRKLVRDREREYCDPSRGEETLRVRDVIARDARAQVLIQ